MIINVWVAKLLRIKSIVGYYVIRPDNGKGSLVTPNLFSIVRHPDYLSHISPLAWIPFVNGLSKFMDLTLIPLEERTGLKIHARIYWI